MRSTLITVQELIPEKSLALRKECALRKRLYLQQLSQMEQSTLENGVKAVKGLEEVSRNGLMARNTSGNGEMIRPTDMES